MPISGLSEINRPPRQGMLRLGIKKKTQTGKEYPAEVDYFILDPETPDEEEKARLIREFHDAFGAKPKTIAITLPYSDIDEVFPQNYKRYGRNTSLKCIGDGVTATCTEEEFSHDLKTIGFDERGNTKVECKGRDCVFASTNEKNKTRECKATATLSVDIWPLGGIGVWQVTTGSFNSIVNINSCIRSIVAKYGRAHALPLILERRPQETTYNGKKTTHYTLHINTDKSITEMVRQAQIAPERVLIEAYGTEVAALPVPAEIMDAETTTEPEKTIDDEQTAHRGKLAKDVERIQEQERDVLRKEFDKDIIDSVCADARNIQEKVKADPTDSPDNLAEYDKTTDKVLETFDGEVKEIHLSGEAKESKEFLTGLEKDAKEELGSDGNQDPKIVFPKLFPKFMVFCKQQLEAAGKGDMYKDAFHLYSVKTAADLEKDDKKQKDIRKYLEGLLEEQTGAVV